MDWVEIPTGHPLFVTSHGKVKSCTVPYRVVFFDSFGHDRAQQPGPSQPAIRPEAVCNGWSEPSVDSQFHGLPDSQPRAENEPANEPVSAPSSQFVLSDGGLSRQRRRFGRRRLAKRSVQSLSEADKLYWVDFQGLQDSASDGISESDGSEDNALTDEYMSDSNTERGIQVVSDDPGTSIFSVVQADMEYEDCQHLREALIIEFKEQVFTRKTFTQVDNDKRGPHAKVKLQLIPNAIPFSCKAIRTVGVREQVLYDKIKGFEEQGFIRKCRGSTEWVSRAFLVPKPNGKWRLVIDYRYLNTQLKGLNFPLPVIEDQLARQEGNSVFSLVDLEDGFHQMHLEESSRSLTAFITPFGVYEWKVLPMGVKVGPQVFQRLVAWVVRNCPTSGPYIDDVLTGTGVPRNYAPSDHGPGKLFDSHAYADKPADTFLNPCFSPPPILPDGTANSDMVTPFSYIIPSHPSSQDKLYYHYLCMRELFRAFASADLTVKPEKCFLLRRQVQYVGHVLCNGKRFPNPSKTQALRDTEIKHITNAKALKGFLGLANWYSMYIRNYAKYAAPLMEALKGMYQFEDVQGGPAVDGNGLPCKARKRVKLTAKQSEIKWTPEMEWGFQQIKDSLIEKVELYLPRPGARWRLSTDASDFAVGGVLEQEQDDGNWHPVAFFSRKLQGSKTAGKHRDKGIGQVGWTVREKETYAVVCSLLKFQSWIGHQEVLVRTDHSSIVQWYKEDLCTASGPLGRRGRWHEFLSRFHLVILYYKGAENEAPDALSRWAYPAGLSQDVSFHGSENDLEGWNQCEQREREYTQRKLRERHPNDFGEYRTVRACMVPDCTECVAVHIPHQTEARELLLEARAVAEIGHISDHPSLVHASAFADIDGFHFYCNPAVFQQSRPSRVVKRELRHTEISTVSCVSVGDGHELSIDRVEDLHIHTLNTIKLPADTAVLYSDWDPEYAADPVLGPHWTTLQADGVSGQYRLHMGRVRLAGRICVPLSLLDKVIVATHTYAHPGIHKTNQLIDRKYIFQELDKGQPRTFSYTKLKEHIALQLGHCQVCQAVKGRKGLQPDTMHSYPIPEYPFSSIAADFCKLDEVKQGAVVYDSVFVILCRLTGYVMALPCSTTITSSELASLFLTRFVTFFGLPKEIFSDVDKIMHADFFSTFCQLSGIEEYRSPVYRKKSNGRAERAVQVVVESLRKL